MARRSRESPRVDEYLAANAGKTADDAVAAVGRAVTASPGRSAAGPALHIPGLASAQLNATFFIGAVLMLIIFAIQHRGILAPANTQKVIGLLVIIPMLIVGVVPILNGSISTGQFLAVSCRRPPCARCRAWNNRGWTLFLGGLFIAAWSTYAFETAVCYTSEFKNPQTDTFKAIFYSGLLCMVLFILVPFTFQGVLGVAGMTDRGVVAGPASPMRSPTWSAAAAIVHSILVLLMILALILSIMTAMAGSSRTLYQGSVDGWLPRYLTHVNSHGAPTRAMWTDLVFNLILLSSSPRDVTGYFFVLAVSNIGYIIFNFLNLNAGWIHRVDSGHIPRPWKAPDWLIGVNTVLAFVNASSSAPAPRCGTQCCCGPASSPRR